MPCPQQSLPSTNSAHLQLLHHQPWVGPISEGLSEVLCPLLSPSCCFHATWCVKSIVFCQWWLVPLSRASMGGAHRLHTCAAPQWTSQSRFTLQVSASDCGGHKSVRNSSEGLGPYGVCVRSAHTTGEHRPVFGAGGFQSLRKGQSSVSNWVLWNTYMYTVNVCLPEQRSLCFPRVCTLVMKAGLGASPARLRAALWGCRVQAAPAALPSSQMYGFGFQCKNTSLS